MLLRKPHGHVTQTPEFGKPQENDTLCCAHCNAHWHVPPGQGNTRGYCQTCAAPICNGPWCVGGCPGAFEQQIEAYERRMAHLALRGY